MNPGDIIGKLPLKPSKMRILRILQQMEARNGVHDLLKRNTISKRSKARKQTRRTPKASVTVATRSRFKKIDLGDRGILLHSMNLILLCKSLLSSLLC